VVDVNAGVLINCLESWLTRQGMSAARAPEPSRYALLNSTRAAVQRPEARVIAILSAAGLLRAAGGRSRLLDHP
jgi:hypothetical protein